jgi:uncharacterized membrane protein
MMFDYALPLALHALAAIVWVGGMFFAHMTVRPSVLALPPPQRLPLMRAIMGRFFAWVWVAIVTLLATGYGVLLFGYGGGMGGGGPYVDAMQGIGGVMMALFLYLFFAPWQSFKLAVAAEDFPKAAGHLARIRWIIAVNLVLGLITAAIGAMGAFVTG